MSVPLAFRMTGARVSRRGATRRGAPGASAVLVRRLVPLLFAVLLEAPLPRGSWRWLFF